MTYLTLLTTILGFLCSLAYNYGFFWGYDSGISLLSITDILKSYSLWIPGILGFILIGYYFDAISTHIEKNKTEDQLAQGTSNPERTKAIRDFFSNKALSLFLYLVLIVYIFIGRPYEPILLGAACFMLWGNLGSYILSKSKTDNLKRIILEISILLPLFIIPMFFLGLYDAETKEGITKPNVILYLAHNPNNKHPTILIRNLESGLLVKENGLYELYTWNTIDKITPIEKTKFLGILCKYFKKC